MKVLVLGAGKMTGAILKGLNASEDLSQWMIYSPSGKSASELAESIGASFVESLDSLHGVTHVFVGCKPQQLEGLKKTIGDRFQGAIFVSLLAAVKEQQQCHILQINNLIRVMPNLAVEYREGVSLISSSLPLDQIEPVQKLFSLLGMSLVVSEDELEDLTLLTGSGPALYYEFSSHLVKQFSSLSLAEREELAVQVMRGTAQMAKTSHQSFEVLTAAVTSKGGVTIAVLEEWRNKDFFQMISSGIQRGKQRSLEIIDLLRK